MHIPNHSDRTKIRERMRASFSLLCFGLTLLALLIAIDRPGWFVLRPASGTAAALSKASVPPVGGDDGAPAGAGVARAAR